MKRLATDGTIRDGLGQAFEKGFDVPDQFVNTAYKDTSDESADYVDEGHFARDLRAVKVPKLVIFGKDDRLVKPAAAETYHREFGLAVRLVAGAGHRRWSSSRPRRRGSSWAVPTSGAVPDKDGGADVDGGQASAPGAMADPQTAVTGAEEQQIASHRDPGELVQLGDD
jgi:hypothetical protein